MEDDNVGSRQDWQPKHSPVSVRDGSLSIWQHRALLRQPFQLLQGQGSCRHQVGLLQSLHQLLPFNACRQAQAPTCWSHLIPNTSGIAD